MEKTPRCGAFGGTFRRLLESCMQTGKTGDVSQSATARKNGTLVIHTLVNRCICIPWLLEREIPRHVKPPAQKMQRQLGSAADALHQTVQLRSQPRNGGYPVSIRCGWYGVVLHRSSCPSSPGLSSFHPCFLALHLAIPGICRVAPKDFPPLPLHRWLEQTE